MSKADARDKVGGLSAPMQVINGGRIPEKGMRKGGESSSEDQGMKVAGRIQEMLKGFEYMLKKCVLTGLTISKSMHTSSPKHCQIRGSVVRREFVYIEEGTQGKGVRCRASRGSCQVGAEVTRSVEGS